jgi:hypothetical protein
MKRKNEIKQHRLGWGAGLIVGLFGRKPRSLSDTELYKNDFHPNTRNMGLRFSDRLRKVFRLRWLRLE